jgi:DNA-binding MarR family transcriptional regulator
MAQRIQSISGLEEHVGYWLRFVSNHVSYAFGVKVEALGVTVAEWVALRAIYDADGMNPSLLAEKLGMTRGAISKLVDRLNARGLVQRSIEKTDKRYQWVRLTAAGKSLVPHLAREADRNDTEFFGHLSKAERAELVRMLTGIVLRHGLQHVPVD